MKYLKENFNISTNNLFQVLPQEKTCSILTNDPKRNLLNIEKAVRYDLVYYYYYLYFINSINNIYR